MTNYILALRFECIYREIDVKITGGDVGHVDRAKVDRAKVDRAKKVQWQDWNCQS